MEDNEVLDETTYLLRSPENARRLLKSIKEVEKGSINKVSINSLLKPHKQRNFGLLKDNIKLPEDFGELDDEITELFTD
jgi:hypothetical protein